MEQNEPGYPVQFTVDYPDQPLNRLSSFFRLFAAIPILVVFGLMTADSDAVDSAIKAGGVAGGILFLPVLLMILFRRKYPKWWFDWNFALQKFENRVSAYVMLLRDEYPSTDEDQAVHLELPYPDAATDLNRWLPLIKWFLAIPHYVALIVLSVVGLVLVVLAWFVILFTGRYPAELFNFVVGVLRWYNRVAAYAFLLVTDRYPPFRLSP